MRGQPLSRGAKRIEEIKMKRLFETEPMKLQGDKNSGKNRWQKQCLA